MSKKPYEPELKVKLALEVIKGQKSVVEISAEYNVPQTNLYDWRDKLLNEAATLFIPQGQREKQVRGLEKEVDALHKIIGEFSVENNFLKKKLKN